QRAALAQRSKVRRWLEGSEDALLGAVQPIQEETIPYPEIVDFSITGPGTVTTGGGFIGGGFGVAGALEGMAVAAVLNALTSRTKVHTFIGLVTHQGELFLHYEGMEPGALRIALRGGVYLRAPIRSDVAGRPAGEAERPPESTGSRRGAV